MLTMRRRRNSLYVRPALTQRLILGVHGGFDQLAEAWAERSASTTDFPMPKSAATVRRWLQQGIPVKRPGDGIFSLRKLDLSVFGLSGLLDVDPIAIFDFERNGYFSDFSALRRVFHQNRYRMGGLAPMVGMFKPTNRWPSDEIAQLCYGQPWFSREFSSASDWDFNSYLFVSAAFSARRNDEPLAIHIAYRMQRGRDLLWRYYGTVLLVDGQLKLYSEGGDHMETKAIRTNTIAFRTFYAGGDVSWRLASLHKFDMEIVMNCSDEQTIGFLW